MQKDNIIGRNARAVTNTFGLLDNNGVCVIPCEYDNLTWLSDFTIDVEKGNKHAVFNNNGRQLTDFIYLVIGQPGANGLCKVREGNKYGFVDFDTAVTHN